MISKDIKISNINEKNANEAKELILRGLSEYFGFCDPTLNPDLHDILKTYTASKCTFLVATFNDKVIGTGALIEEMDGVARVVRMSTDKEYRRFRVGTKILHSLEEIAMDKNYTKIVLETTKTWETARLFYLSNGYIEDHEDEEDVHFFKIIG